VKLFFLFFLAYGLTKVTESLPAKIWGGLGRLVWEEIENAQTVHKPKLKFIYRCTSCVVTVSRDQILTLKKTHAFQKNKIVKSDLIRIGMHVSQLAARL
jgi:hypothetical protein